MSGIATAIIGLGMGVYGAVESKKSQRKAERKERQAAARRMSLEANRQDIPNFADDLNNPYANLQVATRAAEMQAEQADISLASSLDTLRATGASAGGATALARAAAQSKRGVSANLEQQEAQNARLRAQGEMQTAQMRQRGEMATFQATEARENQALDREASLESSYNQQAAAHKAQANVAMGQAVGSLATGVAGGAFKGTEGGKAWRGLDASQKTAWRDAGGTAASFKSSINSPGVGSISQSQQKLFNTLYNPSGSTNPLKLNAGNELNAVTDGGNIWDTTNKDSYFYDYDTGTDSRGAANTVDDFYNMFMQGGVGSSWGVGGIGQAQGYIYRGLSQYAGIPQQGGNISGDYSDRRLKEDIKLIGYSPSGLNIYSFKYIGGNKTYQGVMSDEIPEYAVIKDSNGYDKVDYSKLDVKFKLI